MPDLKILISGSEASQITYETAVAALGCEFYTAYYPPASAKEYDGLILCGGSDVDPCFYGEELDGSFGIYKKARRGGN